MLGLQIHHSVVCYNFTIETQEMISNHGKLGQSLKNSPTPNNFRDTPGPWLQTLSNIYEYHGDSNITIITDVLCQNRCGTIISPRCSVAKTA